MEHILKKLRKLENSNLLVVSKDDEFTNQTKDIFVNCKTFTSTQSNKDGLDLCKNGNVEVVIIDTNSENYKDFLKEIENLHTILTVVLVIDNYEEHEEHMVAAINSEVYSVMAKPFNVGNLKLSVIMSLNQTTRSDKINLGYGYYFDVYRDRVYTRSGKAVEFTKLELGLLKLILDNWGEVVDYEMIEKQVWKGKKMSIFTMRNVVNKIRSKTYFDVFKNASSKGYIIS